MKNTNVLLLTVDALRRDRLGFSGYKRNTSPNIDKLTQQAIWCDNSFSLAPSTQPSIPTIITSTQPLSYGGYDMGIKYRPNSLTEILPELMGPELNISLSFKDQLKNDPRVKAFKEFLVSEIKKSFP